MYVFYDEKLFDKYIRNWEKVSNVIKNKFNKY